MIAGLNFARQSGWYQNIQAAGTCRMRLRGEQLTLGAPALVPAAAAGRFRRRWSQAARAKVTSPAAPLAWISP